LGDVRILDCESIYECIDEIFTALAYPVCLSSCLVYGSSLFYDDHQFIDGSRCERFRGQRGNGDSAA